MAIGLSVPPIGTVLNGKYCLETVLGEGVMGIVFRALNTRLGQHVAIKIPQAIVLAEPSLVDRFAREAKAAARLRHRNSARVIDVDTSEDGVPYLVRSFSVGGIWRRSSRNAVSSRSVKRWATLSKPARPWWRRTCEASCTVTSSRRICS